MRTCLSFKKYIIVTSLHSEIEIKKNDIRTCSHDSCRANVSKFVFLNFWKLKIITRLKKIKWHAPTTVVVRTCQIWKTFIRYWRETKSSDMLSRQLSWERVYLRFLKFWKLTTIKRHAVLENVSHSKKINRHVLTTVVVRTCQFRFLKYWQLKIMRKQQFEFRINTLW